MLDSALNISNGYKSIFDCEGENLTETQIFNLKNKSLYLQNAYNIAMKKLGTTTFKWREVCCKEAVTMLSDLGINKIRLGG